MRGSPGKAGSAVRQRVARLGVLSLLAAQASACTYVEHLHVHTTSRPIVQPSPASSDARLPLEDPLEGVVRIASVHGECVATVVGDRIAITSRSCAERLTQPSTFPVDRVRARVGGGVVAWRVVPVLAILAAPCHGVAAVVTDAPIGDAPPMRMRLGDAPTIGEPVRAIGFGRCSGVSMGHRVVGWAGRVRELDGTVVVTDARACSGDAGGPLVSDWTGEVVGVLLGAPLQTDVEPGSALSGAAARVDVAGGLLAQAFLVAHGAKPTDLPPIACP